MPIFIWPVRDAGIAGAWRNPLILRSFRRSKRVRLEVTTISFVLVLIWSRKSFSRTASAKIMMVFALSSRPRLMAIRRIGIPGFRCRLAAPGSPPSPFFSALITELILIGILSARIFSRTASVLKKSASSASTWI
jgi:hypothetical protein